MSWANPLAAWFLLLIPAVIALYFLKLKRQDVVVSSTLLWSKALQDRRVNSPFQRLRKSLLLLLQILAILILVGALAGPEYESDLFYGRTHILLLDTSASMGTQEGSSTRLELAQAAAHEYLDRVPGGESVVLIRFAKRAQALTPVTEDFGLVERAIDQQVVRGAATSLDDAMELALSIARNLQDARAVVFSDGGFPPWGSGEVELPIDYQAIGSSANNSGLVALSTRMDLTGSGLPQVFVEVRNFGPDAVSGLVSISQDDVVVRAADAEVEADGRWSQSFEAQGAGLIAVTWEPEGEDALVADNTAWVEISPQREIRVWRVGEDNFMLDAGLSSIPFVVSRAVALADLEAELRDAALPPDVIVWERASPEKLPEGVSGHLFVGALPPGVWEGELGSQELPQVVSWDRSHPVNRFLNYNTIQIAEATILTTAPGITPLVEIRGGALIAAFNVPGGRGVAVGFDSLNSTWHTDLSYALFLHNALVFLAENEYQKDPIVRGEGLLSLKAPGVDSNFLIRRPDGRVDERPPEDGGWLRYSETDAIGPYEITWQETDSGGARINELRVVPVNLLSALESETAPRETLEVAGRSIEGKEIQGATRIQDLWPWLVAAALLLLLGEWYYYHRR